MTSHEKYNLKTDVTSIKGRIVTTMISGALNAEQIEIFFADLALLCSLAEKGERYEKLYDTNWNGTLDAAVAIDDVADWASELPLSIRGYNTPESSQYVSEKINIARDFIDSIRNIFIQEAEGE